MGGRPSIAFAPLSAGGAAMVRLVAPFHTPGSPEAVSPARFPTNVAVGFPAPRSSKLGFTALQALHASE